MGWKRAAELADRIYGEGITGAEEVGARIGTDPAVRTRGDMADVMLALVRKNALYSEFVRANVLGCAERTNRFLCMVAGVSQEHGGAHALAPLEGLRCRQPGVADWLLARLAEINDGRTAYAMAFLYAGVGATDPERLFSMAGRRMAAAQRAAYAVAVAILYPKARVPRGVVEFVVRMSASRTAAVRHAAITAMARSLLPSPAARRGLVRVSVHGSAADKALAAYNVARSRAHRGFAFRVIKNCSAEAGIKDTLTYALADFAPERPLECMRIVRRWSRSDPGYAGRSAGLLRGIGEGDLSRIHAFMRAWARDAGPAGAKAVARVIAAVYRKDDANLARLLDAIGYRGKKTKKVMILSLWHIAASDPGSSNHSEEFYRHCTGIAEGLAGHYGIMVSPDARIDRPALRLAGMIRDIRLGRRIPSTSDARRNQRRFGNIVRFLGCRRMGAITSDALHPLTWYLAGAGITEAYIRRRTGAIRGEESSRRAWAMESRLNSRRYHKVLLDGIDRSLPLLGGMERANRIKDGLANRSEFFETLIELDMAAVMKEAGCRVTLQPALSNSKVLDIEAGMGGADVLFEVVRPMEDYMLSTMGTAYAVRNMVRDQISGKLGDKLEGAVLSKPLVIVIDVTGAGSILDSDVSEALFGSVAYVEKLDGDGKTVGMHALRKGDSIYDKSKHAGALSAVMLVRRGYDTSEMRTKTEGAVYEAPSPRIRLGRRAAEALRGMFSARCVDVCSWDRWEAHARARKYACAGPGGGE